MSSPSFDRVALVLLVAGGLALAVRAWLADHPQHNPWAPLDLRDPPGWATRHKLAALRQQPAECREVLERSGVDFAVLPPAGEDFIVSFISQRGTGDRIAAFLAGRGLVEGVDFVLAA